MLPILGLLLAPLTFISAPVASVLGCVLGGLKFHSFVSVGFKPAAYLFHHGIFPTINWFANIASKNIIPVPSNPVTIASSIREESLPWISPEAREYGTRVCDKILQFAPGLKAIVEDPNRIQELNDIQSMIAGVIWAIKGTRANDHSESPEDCDTTPRTPLTNRHGKSSAKAKGERLAGDTINGVDTNH